MRLIDADALLYDLEIVPLTGDGGVDANDLEEIIKQQPTIEERKTGRWIDAVFPNDNGGLPVQVCDQCNTFFPLAYTGGGHHFCPNCGAKMEVDNE